MRRAILVLAFAAALARGPHSPCPPAKADSPDSDPAKVLERLFEESWEETLEDDPAYATSLGDKRYNDRWPDESPAAFDRRHARDRRTLERLRAIDPKSLSPENRLHYRLFEKQLQSRIEGFPHRWHLLPIHQREGVQTADDVADAIRFETVRDYEDWLARLRSLPTLIDQQIALMREGIHAGRVHPQIIVSRLPEQVKNQIVATPAASPFFRPFRAFPPTVSPAEERRLTDAAKRAIAEGVVPSFQKLLAFLEREYSPSAPERVGVGSWPGGPEMYAYFARRYTTTDLSPEEIHKIGLREVERIKAEMKGVLRELQYEGTFEQFLQHLRTDSSFYYKSPEELLEGYRSLCKRIDPTLVRLFGRLPRMPYGVEPIPASIAPDTTTAYYRWPAADGSRAGTYFVNLFRPEVRPKYEMEALSLHESVPGHHLQIALAMELENLPKFRRYGTGAYTAFVEGWGLYAESLGSELGFYADPYSKFGALTYEMWRAVRLVVDTGMHSLGWTRERALDFFRKHAAKTELDMTNEIDRYIAWPGQALAYKIGELRIKGLRRRAQEELGPRFDVRAFHEVVLGSGSVPLDVLEDNVEDWLEKQKAAAAPTAR